jgi:hypothetical protein
MSTDTIRGFAGKDWLRSNLKYANPKMTLSPLGVKVADLLGDLYYGLYHLDNGVYEKVDWSNNHHIEIILPDSNWSTFDFTQLTRFVFLCHEYGVRGQLQVANFGRLRFLFHDPAVSSGSPHPTIAEAVERFESEAKK